MSRAVGSRGRGGFSGGRGWSRGGFQHRDAGPPDTVLEMGSFVHAVEDEMLCASSMPDKVPHFNAPIYLQNKSEIGKVDEILGPINEVFFSVKMAQGMVASSFKRGDKVYIGGDKLLPIERFLPKPKVAGGKFASLGLNFKTVLTWILHIGVQKRGRGSWGGPAGRGRGSRGGFQRAGGGRGRGVARGGYGGDRGGRGNSRGGFGDRGRGRSAGRGGGRRGGFRGS
ncbi:GAR1 [Sanghuangporus weigelae]